ncbi:MAG: SDR family oxidoreductase [Clostridia bacterium]|nr:SDR family oxidoreductase [Clostridia bacterium]
MIALVTGAGTGIGKGIALKLAYSGYDVAVHYNSSSLGADAVCEQIAALGKKAISVKADLSDVSSIAKMFDFVEENLGPLDLFVNNAGITDKAPFLETTEELFEKIYKVDVKASYFCMQNACKQMIKHNKKGSIVAISSNHSSAHFADVSVYGTMKAALNKMVEHIAIEMAKYRIRANTISPGWVDTGAERLDNKESTYYKVPLKKWATVEEVADTVVFLASDSAASITGANIVIDNGALLLCDKGERYGL